VKELDQGNMAKELIIIYLGLVWIFSLFIVSMAFGDRWWLHKNITLTITFYGCIAFSVLYPAVVYFVLIR
jgi:uncharacterized protein (DUF983 family)